MKQKTMSVISVFSLLFTSFYGLTGFGNQLTKEQRKELYEKGSISVFDESGNKTGHYVVQFIPGADHVTDDAKQQWKEAADLMGELTQKGFWDETVMTAFWDGVTYAKESVTTYGVGAIGDDFRKTREINRQHAGEFGSTAAAVKNWSLFGLKAVGRTLRTAWGVGAGAAYSVVAPSAAVAYRPVAAGAKSVVAGTLWPAVRYTWNGTAWVLTRGNEEPQKDGLTVTFVPVTSNE